MGGFYCFLRRKNTCFDIVYVCRMNYNTQQIPHGIDNNMPFTTFNFFAAIKAFIFCRTTRFDTL